MKYVAHKKLSFFQRKTGGQDDLKLVKGQTGADKRTKCGFSLRRLIA